MMNKLPQGWVECELKDIAIEILSGSGFPKIYQGNVDGEYPFAKVGDLSKRFKNNFKTIISADNYINKDILTKIKGRPFPKNSIVFPKIGEALKGNYRLINLKEMLFDNNVMGVVVSNNVYVWFIYYYLTIIDFGKFSVATTVPSIQKNSIEQIKIKLPPLNEQKRIVEKIEEEFEKIDKGIEKLELVKEQIKQYKQSVLKSAFEGKLYKTTEWNEYKIKDISSNIQYGYTESASNEKIGPRFLRITDIQNDFVNWNKVPYCKIEKNIECKYLLKNGDFVFARTGATVGKSYLVEKLNEDAVFASYLIRITFKENILNKLIKYYFQTNEYWAQITDNQVGVGQPNVNGTRLGNLKIALPSLIEQQKIVEEIEKRFEVADKVSEVVEQNLEKAKQLKQSILKKAFEGRLVPQDPTDEPALILLERIKNEKQK